jgi:hypothetical protein
MPPSLQPVIRTVGGGMLKEEDVVNSIALEVV